MDLGKYQGLIFDMDGTLIHSMPTHGLAWRKTCGMHGVELDMAWYYQLGGLPTIKTAQRIKDRYTLSVAIETLAEAKIDFFNALDYQAALIEATAQLVRQYHGEKKLAIGTGSRREHARQQLADTEVLPLFDVVVTADDVDKHKPNPDTFLLAAERMGLTPEQCLVFEDTRLGKEAAIAAGMDYVLVTDYRLGEIERVN